MLEVISIRLEEEKKSQMELEDQKQREPMKLNTEQ